MLQTQMKTKSFIILVICIITTSIAVCLLSNQTPRPFQTIVSETHKKITDLKKLNQYVSSRKEVSPEVKKYLTLLGFVNSPHTYPKDVPSNITAPVFVAAVTRYKGVQGLVKSVKRYFPDWFLVLYGVGLDQGDAKLLMKFCNCTYRALDITLYPSHISDISVAAYRPLVIQMALNEFGAVIFLDTSVRVLTVQINQTLADAQKSGLLAWPAIDESDQESRAPTSAYTHPKMFNYFGTQAASFYFHRMAESKNMIVFNTPEIHQKLMLPWVQCALTPDCIAPIGSQGTGCIWDRKPLFKYSGCHRYDMSAFNVVLGIMFDHNVKPYLSTVTLEERFFGPVRPDKPAMVDNSKESNVTTTLNYL